MVKHHNEHDAGHEHVRPSQNRGLHQDWRAWMVVLLMLAAMAAYILSMDEAEAPGGKADEVGVPAAAE